MGQVARVSHFAAYTGRQRRRYAAPVALDDDPPGRPQEWPGCDADIAAFVDRTVDLLQDDLGDDLTGVYLHGSLAMGSYFRPKSDIDVLVVVEAPLTVQQRGAVARSLAAHMRTRPVVGNLELSVITAAVARATPVPVPYEVHVSSMWQARILADEMNYAGDPTDPDLPAHLTHCRQRGIALTGRPIEETFGEIAWEAFLEAVDEDAGWVLQGSNLLESPFYGILNLCRVIQLRQQSDRRVHSKDEGARWAMQNLPGEHREVVRRAWTVYRSETEVAESDRRTGGLTWPEADLLSFRDFARATLMIP